MSKESKEWEKFGKDIIPTFDKSTQTERISPKMSPMTRIRQILEETNKESTSSLIILAHGKKDSPLMKKISSHAEQIKEEDEIFEGFEK